LKNFRKRCDFTV